MKTKIVITVNGGNIQNIISNQNIEIALIDYDNIEQGGEKVVIYEPDAISKKLAPLFDPEMATILKRKGF